MKDGNSKGRMTPSQIALNIGVQPTHGTQDL